MKGYKIQDTRTQTNINNQTSITKRLFLGVWNLVIVCFLFLVSCILSSKVRVQREMKSDQGAILMLTLVFTSLFVIVAGGLVGLAVGQNKLGMRKMRREQALQIAEAGVNYYRWHLAHDPNDYTDGTGLPGPYVHTYNDPQGGSIGQFSLDIIPPGNCTNATTITSTGVTDDEPNIERVVQSQYALPSLAKFAFLTNSNVWFGDEEELHGPVHSNGGIRQDGLNDGIVTSAKATYICGPEHGCSNETKPGIWGTGGDQALWDFPVAAIDFNSITADIASLKATAQSSGLYFGPLGRGYHVIIRNDGTMDVYHVNQLYPKVWSYDSTQWVYDSKDILGELFVGNFALPNDCPIIFFEDDVWVEGVVNNKAVTIVAAALPDVPATNATIYINGNIVYQQRNDQTSLSLIAQKDVLVPLYAAPDNLQIDGVLLAQKGHVFRNYYPSWYSPYHIRNSISLYGAIITNTIWTWSWVNGSGTVISGYTNTNTVYDPRLKYNPPPGFPNEGSEYDFIQWEEITDK